MFDTTTFVEKLTAVDAVRPPDTVNTETVDRIKPELAENWPTAINAALQTALAGVGIAQPYLDQANAVSRSLGGLEVVMESPTASGKTLAFAVPMLDALLQTLPSVNGLAGRPA